jgi:hypothetical protein
MTDKALVINSHSSNIECLNLFFFCFETFIDQDYFNSVYLFIDECDYTAPKYAKIINYDKKDSFKDQMVYCLSNVEEDILLYCNEDYLFYDAARIDIADKTLEELINSELSFVKFCYTDIEEYLEYKPNLFLIDKNCKNTFSQTLSFWKTRDLLKIHENCPRSEIGAKGDIFGHLEVAAIDVCKTLDVKGVCYYNNEPKRGMVHFDTEVFPHIASAIERGGRWTADYPKELEKVIKLYNENY